MKTSVQMFQTKVLQKIADLKPLFEKNKRLFIICDSALVILVSIILIVVSGMSGTSQASLAFQFDSDAPSAATPLYALNRPAKKAVISTASSPYAYFCFTDDQKNLIAEAYKKNGGAAVSISICVHKNTAKKIAEIRSSGTPKPFSFGFFYSDDFISSKKLKKEISGRPLVSTDLTSFASENDTRFSASFCLSKPSDKNNSSIPSGFFVYSVLPINIEKASVIPSIVGWNRNENFFAFAPNGGTIDLSFSSFDFSGASMVFPVQNTDSALMPQFEAVVESPSKSSKNEEESIPVCMIFSGEKTTFYCTSSQKGSRTFLVPAASLENPFAPVRQDENSDLVESVMLKASNSNLLKKKNGSPLFPYRCDPGLIISWKVKNWRGNDFELFEWQQFPGVLYFDTRSYAVQRDFFRRLAFFTEKAGYRGRLLTDVELGSLHGYNAHDYSSASLASFFSAATKQGFALNQREYLLRDILLENGVILKNNEGLYDAGNGAVISISQESQPWLRRTFVAHEGWHGIFFTDADYRNAVGAVYYTMDQRALQYLHEFWSTQSGLQYDLNDTNLMHNEMMAYLMQQPLSQTKSYFTTQAKRPSVQKNQKNTADYILATQASGFEDAAAILDTYAFDHWGFNAGRVWLVSR